MSRRVAPSTVYRSLVAQLPAASTRRYSSTATVAASRIASANPLATKRNAHLSSPLTTTTTSPATITTTEASATDPTNTFLRITLRRSAIGLPKRTRDVLASLGLHRRGAVVFRWAGDRSAAGMVMRVKELVGVEVVPGPSSAAESRRAAEVEVEAQQQVEETMVKKRRNPGVTELPAFVSGAVERLKVRDREARSSYGAEQGFWVESRGGVTVVQPGR